MSMLAGFSVKVATAIYAEKIGLPESWSIFCGEMKSIFLNCIFIYDNFFDGVQVVEN